MITDPDWNSIYAVDGVRLGTVAAGIKYADRDDLLLVELCDGSTVAGAFTQNAFCAAPVTIAKKHLASSSPRYFVINSGNANACTGQEGLDSALSVCSTLAKQSGVNFEDVLPFSTGVIGEILDSNKINAALPRAIGNLNSESWEQAARAIMTTDTVPKASSRRIIINGIEVTVTGISKGSGMICPNMATMLSYVFTDVQISQALLQQISNESVSQSFNRITVDGDTSTNDASMIVATGRSDLNIDELGGDSLQKFKAAILEVYQELAKFIVYDGEGATKFVEVLVENAKNSEESLNVAYSIAHSPLVKTAMFASDPNWGRIVAAIGNAPIENLDSSLVDVWLDKVKIVENGERAVEYTEEQGKSIFNKSEFLIRVNLRRGEASEKIWTSDLSHEYVRINAEYRS